MSSFEDRRNASENKHAHDENLKFRIRARRAKIAATWASDILKLDADRTKDYQRKIIEISTESSGDKRIIDQLSADLGLPEDQIKARLDNFENQARIEIESE